MAYPHTSHSPVFPITHISLTNSISEYPRIRDVINLSTGPFQGHYPIGWNLPDQAPIVLPGSHWKGLACRDTSSQCRGNRNGHTKASILACTVEDVLVWGFCFTLYLDQAFDLSLFQRLYRNQGPGSVHRALPDKPWYVCLGTKMKFRGLTKPTGLITGSHLYVPEWWLWVNSKGNKSPKPPELDARTPSPVVHTLQFNSVQSLSRVWLFVTPWTAACQASLSIINSQSLLKFMSIGSVMPSNHLILCRPFLLPPSIFPSIRVFSNESVLCIRWPKYWSFSFSISPSNEYSGLISFRMDWLDLHAVQVTLKSSPTPQFKSINSLALSFLRVQLSHPYMTIGKTISLTRWTFVGKVMSLHFNMLSRFVIAFLPKSKRLLISWVQSVTICSDFGAPQNKVCHCVHCFPIYLPWSDGTRCHDLSFLNVEFYFFFLGCYLAISTELY